MRTCPLPFVASFALLFPLPFPLPFPLVAQDEAPPRTALRVVEITGSPWERGCAHGTALRAEIATLLRRWDADLQRNFGVSRDEFVRRFLAGTSYDAAARKWTPELLDEVRGIAAGAAVEYPTMLAWQLIDEIWAMGPAVARDKCTAFGVDRIGGQPAFVAQNLDVPAWYHGFPTVLHLRDEARRLQAFVVTIPGLVGAAGMNNARVAVACNTLLQLRPCRDGLPVAFVVRGLLAQGDHASALAFLQRIVHASGQNYTVGGPLQAPGFECSAGKVVRCEPWPGAPFTFHTNNPFANDDFAAGYAERVRKAGADPFVGVSPCPRLQACRAALPQDARPDVAAVKALLASRASAPSICNDGTYASFVMVLGERPELQIAPGQPDRTPYEVLHFSP
jgi:hypothetical protein